LLNLTTPQLQSLMRFQITQFPNISSNLNREVFQIITTFSWIQRKGVIVEWMQIQTIGFELKWINNKFMNCVSIGVLTRCLATSQNFIHGQSLFPFLFLDDKNFLFDFQLNHNSSLWKWVMLRSYPAK
jgi:hypothetical protein